MSKIKRFSNAVNTCKIQVSIFKVKYSLNMLWLKITKEIIYRNYIQKYVKE